MMPAAGISPPTYDLMLLTVLEYLVLTADGKSSPYDLGSLQQLLVLNRERQEAAAAAGVGVTPQHAADKGAAQQDSSSSSPHAALQEPVLLELAPAVARAARCFDVQAAAAATSDAAKRAVTAANMFRHGMMWAIAEVFNDGELHAASCRVLFPTMRKGCSSCLALASCCSVTWRCSCNSIGNNVWLLIADRRCTPAAVIL
jgi:hypothetical protein